MNFRLFFHEKPKFFNKIRWKFQILPLSPKSRRIFPIPPLPLLITSRQPFLFLIMFPPKFNFFKNRFLLSFFVFSLHFFSLYYFCLIYKSPPPPLKKVLNMIFFCSRFFEENKLNFWEFCLCLPTLPAYCLPTFLNFRKIPIIFLLKKLNLNNNYTKRRYSGDTEMWGTKKNAGKGVRSNKKSNKYVWEISEGRKLRKVWKNGQIFRQKGLKIANFHAKIWKNSVIST